MSLQKSCRPVFHATVSIESECRDAPDCCDVLILFANRLSQPVQFDVASLLRELGGVNDPFLFGVQSLEEGGRKASGGTETGAGGNVSHRSDLEIGTGYLCELESFPNDRMRDGAILRSQQVLGHQVRSNGVHQPKTGETIVCGRRNGENQLGKTEYGGQFISERILASIIDKFFLALHLTETGLPSPTDTASVGLTSVAAAAPGNQAIALGSLGEKLEFTAPAYLH